MSLARPTSGDTAYLAVLILCSATPTGVLSHARKFFSGRWFSLERGAEPGPGVSPLAVSCCARDAERFGSLFEGQPGEEMQLNHPGGHRVFLFQPGEGPVQGHDLLRRRHRHIVLLEVHAVPVAAVLDAFFAAGALHEDAPHGLGGRAEEVPAVAPLVVP